MRLREHETAQLHLESADVCLQRGLRGVLAPGVHGRRNRELRLSPVLDSFGLEFLLEEFAVQLFFDAVEHRTDAEAEIAVVEFERFRECGVHVLLRDVVFLDHAAEHVFQAFLAAGKSLLAAFGVTLDKRVVVEGTLYGTCDKGAFGKGEVLEVLVEKVLRGDGDALSGTRNVELVQVEFQDFFLAEMVFHAERVDKLLALLLDAPFFASENVLDGLLGERGSALAHVAAFQVRDHGAGKAVDAETVVVPVAGVFGGDQGVHDVCRDVAVGHVHAVVCIEKGAQELFSVVIVDAGLARKDLQDGRAVELVVRILGRKDLEDDDIGGNTANQADQSECGHDFE